MDLLQLADDVQCLPMPAATLYSSVYRTQQVESSRSHSRRKVYRKRRDGPGQSGRRKLSSSHGKRRRLIPDSPAGAHGHGPRREPRGGSRDGSGDASNYAITAGRFIQRPARGAREGISSKTVLRSGDEQTDSSLRSAVSDAHHRAAHAGRADGLRPANRPNFGGLPKRPTPALSPLPQEHTPALSELVLVQESAERRGFGDARDYDTRSSGGAAHSDATFVQETPQSSGRARGRADDALLAAHVAHRMDTMMGKWPAQHRRKPGHSKHFGDATRAVRDLLRSYSPAVRPPKRVSAPKVPAPQRLRKEHAAAPRSLLFGGSAGDADSARAAPPIAPRSFLFQFTKHRQLAAAQAAVQASSFTGSSQGGPKRLY